MNQLAYNDDHEIFRASLTDFCREHITPYIDQWERDHLVPKAVWQKLGRAGFLCTSINKKYGGRGGDFLYSAIVLEEISKTNHYGLDTFLHSDIVVPYIDAYATDEQKTKYLPGCVSGDIITAIAMTEPDTGSDLSSMAATAVEQDDMVILNGTKTFISNGVICDLVIVAAKDPSEDNPYKAISLYFVEDGTLGFRKGPPMEKLGVRSQDTNELYFTNCRIPSKNRLGCKGEGFKMLMNKLQQERLLVAMLGLSRASLIYDWAHVFFVNQKQQSPSQSVLFALAEMLTDIKIGRTFMDHLIIQHMDGADISVETSMAKYWMTDLANNVANRCLDMAGTIGLTEACPIVRTFRDVRVMPIFAGTNEIMKTIIAKNLVCH